jgi:hypothetical protein
MKVFIGGSRRIPDLNEDVRDCLDQIIKKGFQVLIGDANGGDKAVQGYLHSRGYEKVEVFRMSGYCRNNLGNWKLREIDAPNGARGFEYYSAKDEQMTNESAIGLMLWDGDSRGTLANVSRLLDQQKKVVVYLSPSREFRTLRSKSDLADIQSAPNRTHRPQPRKQSPSLQRKTSKVQSQRLF